MHALESVCAHHVFKGVIIKTGVIQKVMVPLRLLIIGASEALYHYTTQVTRTISSSTFLRRHRA